MSEAQKIKQILVNVAGSIDIPDFDPKNLSMVQRAILGGKNPIEKAMELITTLPDEAMPHIVEVARAIVRAVDE